MLKRWLHLALLGLLTLGSSGSLWAEARCLTLMSKAQTCCCTGDDTGQSECPVPPQNNDCPMLNQSAKPESAVAPVKFSPQVSLLDWGRLDTAIHSHASSSQAIDLPTFSFRTDRLARAVPPLRAPPAA